MPRGPRKLAIRFDATALTHYGGIYLVHRFLSRIGFEDAGLKILQTIREWRERLQTEGVPGLVPRYPAQKKRRVPDDVVQLIEHARRELRDGAARTRIRLRRVHQKNLPISTIHRTFVRLGLPRLPRARERAPRPRQLRLFEKPNPGDSVQVDAKVVKINGQEAFQYTALDDCTRFRVLRLYRELNQRSSLKFFAELRLAMPFPIQRLQCDNGTEFPLAFVRPHGPAGWPPPPLHEAALSRAERQSRTQSSHRQRGVLEPLGRRPGNGWSGSPGRSRLWSRSS